MSPEKAKVFVAEDSSDWQERFKNILEEAGHSVVAKATNLKQALVIVEQLEQMGVDVAVLDGNLGEGGSGRDGQTVLEAIHEKAPSVKTVGMSSYRVFGTDIDLGKGRVDELGEVVTKL